MGSTMKPQTLASLSLLFAFANLICFACLVTMIVTIYNSPETYQNHEPRTTEICGELNERN